MACQPFIDEQDHREWFTMAGFLAGHPLPALISGAVAMAIDSRIAGPFCAVGSVMGLVLTG
jgi:hypothetical protein